VRRRTSWIAAFSLAALAALAAVAAVPPNLAKTIEAQRRLVAERPDDPAVHNDLGNLLLLASQPEEAEAAYRRAVELDPGKVSSLFNLGLVQQQQGELRDAYKNYRRVVNLEPGHAWAHYQMGSLEERWGQDSKAIASYAEAFALDPQLAFPEVNPHVVDNALVTEAMLRAYRGGNTRPQAPTVYDDPARIAALLVPPPVLATPEAPADQTAAEQRKTQPQTGAQTGRTQPQQQRPTVIREGDLDPTNTSGQATPQGRATGRPGSTQPRGLRQWTRPEPTIQEEPDDFVGEEEGAVPDEVITPPPAGVYYRPGIQSTGRLNIEVVPTPARKAARREGRG
jgi:hypothetical protein